MHSKGHARCAIILANLKYRDKQRGLQAMDEQEDLKIGKFVRLWRESRHMILKELAAVANMNVTQLWSVENDRNSPSVRTIGRLAAALQVSPAELLGPPPDTDDELAASARGRNGEETALCDIVRIMRRDEKEDPKEDFSPSELKRLSEFIHKAIATENDIALGMATSLPLMTPFSLSESGAAQLAHILRSHLDVGSAIIYDVRTLFESHGIRILEDSKLSEAPAIATFYSTSRRNFTVVLSKKLSKAPEHRDFLFMTEIGRIFLFAQHGFEPYRDSARSRRFAHHFAATFLQPAAAVRTATFSLRVKPDDWTYELLLRLKKRFGVSAQAFNIRLKELGLISVAKYEEFDKQINNHYRKTNNSEPQPAKSRFASERLGDLHALRNEYAAPRCRPCNPSESHED